MKKKISAAILAGGTSKRMGENKAFLKIGEDYFIERIAAALKKSCDDVMIISKTPHEYSSLGFLTFSDILPEKNPLVGIHSALVHAQNEHCLIVACDMPFLDDYFIERFIKASEPDKTNVIKSEAGIEPLCAIYPKNIIPFIENLARKNAQVRELFELTPTKVINLSEVSDSANAIQNINTTDEFERIRDFKGKK